MLVVVVVLVVVVDVVVEVVVVEVVVVLVGGKITSFVHSPVDTNLTHS